jgi:hypothetical protein
VADQKQAIEAALEAVERVYERPSLLGGDRSSA